MEDGGYEDKGPAGSADDEDVEEELADIDGGESEEILAGLGDDETVVVLVLEVGDIGDVVGPAPSAAVTLGVGPYFPIRVLPFLVFLNHHYNILAFSWTIPTSTASASSSETTCALTSTPISSKSSPSSQSPMQNKQAQMLTPGPFRKSKM